MTLAAVFVLALKLYLLVGAGFAAWFVIRGASRLDPVAQAGSWGFRILLLPGAIALWPILAIRLGRGGPAPPEERNEHRPQRRRPDR